MRGELEPAEYGDVRPAALLHRLDGALPSRRPRLAWKPWLRWTIINGPIWALLGAAIALWWVRGEAQKAMSKPSHAPWTWEKKHDGRD